MLQDLFHIRRADEEQRFRRDLPNRMLLWHGSRLTNFMGILGQGLRIAPPEAPCTGYMFGKGVYFADMVSKSANYCYTSSRSNIGLLVLAEVSLGTMRELRQADYNASQLPPGAHSTKGVGRMIPNEQEAIVLPDGVKVPLGHPVQNPDAQSTRCARVAGAAHRPSVRGA